MAQMNKHLHSWIKGVSTSEQLDAKDKKKPLSETQLFGDVIWIQVSVWHKENIPIKEQCILMLEWIQDLHQSLYSWGPGLMAKPVKYYYGHATSFFFFCQGSMVKTFKKRFTSIHLYHVALIGLTHLVKYNIITVLFRYLHILLFCPFLFVLI